MLPKKFKIHPRYRVEYLLKKGRRCSGRLLQLRFLPNRLSHHRFTVVVSKKLSNKAAPRNKIRRRVYEALRKNFTLSLKTCYDIAVLMSALAAKGQNIPSYGDIENDVQNCMKKL